MPVGGPRLCLPPSLAIRSVTPPKTKKGESQRLLVLVCTRPRAVLERFLAGCELHRLPARPPAAPRHQHCALAPHTSLGLKEEREERKEVLEAESLSQLFEKLKFIHHIGAEAVKHALKTV